MPQTNTNYFVARSDIFMLSNHRRREKQQEMWIIELLLFVLSVAIDLCAARTLFLFPSFQCFTLFPSSHLFHCTKINQVTQTSSISLKSCTFSSFTSPNFCLPPRLYLLILHFLPHLSCFFTPSLLCQPPSLWALLSITPPASPTRGPLV